MHVEFTPTLDDLQEALAPAPSSSAQTKPRHYQLGKGIFGWVLFIILVIMLVFLRNNQSRPVAPQLAVASSAAVPTPPTQDLLATLLPSLLPCAFLSITVISVLVRQRSNPPRDVDAAHRTNKAIAKLAAFTFAAAVFVAAAAFIFPALSIPWRPSRNIQLLVGLLPWVAFFIPFSLLFSSRRNARIHWNDKPTLRAPKAADADPTALTISSDLTTERFLWSHFTSFRETPNLFVLTTRDREIHYLPKRAFPDPHALDLFRGLLQTAIPSGNTLPAPSAFPVVMSQ